MSALLAGLRHVVAFVAILALVMWVVAVPPPPEPDAYNFITHFRIAMGFVTGWVMHGVYRMWLFGWEDFKRSRAELAQKNQRIASLEKELGMAAVLAIALLLMPTGAEAQDSEANWVRYVLKRQCYRHVDAFGAVSYPCYRRRVAVREYAQNHRYRLVDEHAYRAPERERDEPPRVHCLWDQGPMRATGDDKLEEDRAQVSAQDHWSATVENRFGTRYSDIRYAANATSSCPRKVPTSATEKGQAILGIRHFVCEFEATPCAAPKLPVDEDTRAKRGSERADDAAARRADPRPARVEYYQAPPPPKRRFWQRRD